MLASGEARDRHKSKTVLADTAYRSKANQGFMEKQAFVSKVHCKKPHLKPMPRHTQKSNAGKFVIRSRVEHVFADQKSQTGLFSRHSASYHENRAGQHHLQYAPLPLPRTDQRERVAIQQMISPNQLKAQIRNHQ